MTNRRTPAPKTYAQRQADKARKASAAAAKRRKAGIRTYTGTFAEQQAAMAADRAKDAANRAAWAAQHEANAARRAEAMSTPEGAAALAAEDKAISDSLARTSDFYAKARA